MIKKKPNCWEVKECGRQPGGIKVDEFGICPAATEERVDGVNGGSNGGRSCWQIAGTMCGGAVQGSGASKLGDCMKCGFYQQVMREEGPDYHGSLEILEILNSN